MRPISYNLNIVYGDTASESFTCTCPHAEYGLLVVSMPAKDIIHFETVRISYLLQDYFISTFNCLFICQQESVDDMVYLSLFYFQFIYIILCLCNLKRVSYALHYQLECRLSHYIIYKTMLTRMKCMFAVFRPSKLSCTQLYFSTLKQEHLLLTI